MISITLIGAGNVATHLYRAFSKSDKTLINQWYNRSIEDIEPFKNDVDITNNISEIIPVDIIIIATTDDSIKSLSKKLPIDKGFVVHTSGSLSLHSLDKKNTRGVFYPLQSFSKELDVDFKNVPICIETEDKSKLQLLKDLAEAIGSPVYKISSEQRQTLHLAAVFANNFTNQLYRIAHEISDAKSINFDILKPLILKTAKKVQDISPYRAQTGPALRNDLKTIKRHLKLIDQTEHRQIYELLTKSIKNTHGH